MIVSIESTSGGGQAQALGLEHGQQARGQPEPGEDAHGRSDHADHQSLDGDGPQHLPRGAPRPAAAAPRLRWATRMEKVL